jgi:glycosyltransferase involved in cell wall biosynthesis
VTERTAGDGGRESEGRTPEQRSEAEAPGQHGRYPTRPRVVILRGHQANPWELRPWEAPAVAASYAVSYVSSRGGWFDTQSVVLEHRRARTLRDLLPRGRIGDLAVRVPGDRYLGLASALRGADIVHSQELGNWYSMQAAKLKQRLGFRLVLTVWETIPFLDAYRNVRTRAYRAETLARTDLFIAATERARLSLLLEGAASERIIVSAPGVDTSRFRPSSSATTTAAPRTIVSPGRLVWEKGHQDVLRAVALLARGVGGGRVVGPQELRVLIVGAGSEQRRLRTYARELGIAEMVEFKASVPYADMPSIFAAAACVVLASLAVWYWEEQFGMVLAEATACGIPLIVSSSGAIPEVAGPRATYFTPGDWVGLAELLRGVLRAPPRSGPPEEGATRFSADAAAARLAAAYERVLS